MSSFTDAFLWMKKGNKVKDRNNQILESDIHHLGVIVYVDRFGDNGNMNYIISIDDIESNEWELILPEYTKEQKELISEFTEKLFLCIDTGIEQAEEKSDIRLLHAFKEMICNNKEQYGIEE